MAPSTGTYHTKPLQHPDVRCGELAHALRQIHSLFQDVDTCFQVLLTFDLIIRFDRRVLVEVFEEAYSSLDCFSKDPRLGRETLTQS